MLKYINFINKKELENINESDNVTFKSHDLNSVRFQKPEEKQNGRNEEFFSSIERNGKLLQTDNNNNKMWRIEDNENGTADIFFNYTDQVKVKNAIKNYDNILKDRVDSHAELINPINGSISNNDHIRTIIPGTVRKIDGEWILDKKPVLWIYKDIKISHLKADIMGFY